MDLMTFKAAAAISMDLANRWHPHLLDVMGFYMIDTPQRRACFIAQIGAESGGFAKLSESLNYSVEGLLATFTRERISAEDCRRLGRKSNEKALSQDRQAEIARIVYGGRFGNNRLGDGWKYRGRGLKQVTFKDNYAACGQDLGLDLVANPDLLLQDQWAMKSAGWFWGRHNLNRLADSGDFVQMTKVINGGTNGLKDRQSRLSIAKEALGLR